MPWAISETCSAVNWPPLATANAGISVPARPSATTRFSSASGNRARNNLSLSGGAGPTCRQLHDSRRSSAHTTPRKTSLPGGASDQRAWAGRAGRNHSPKSRTPASKAQQSPGADGNLRGGRETCAERGQRSFTGDLRPGSKPESAAARRAAAGRRDETFWERTTTIDMARP